MVFVVSVSGIWSTGALFPAYARQAGREAKYVNDRSNSGYAYPD